MWYRFDGSQAARFSPRGKYYCPGCADFRAYEQTTRAASTEGDYRHYCPRCGSEVLALFGMGMRNVEPSYTAVSEYFEEAKHMRRPCCLIHFYGTAKVTKPRHYKELRARA